MVYSPYFLQNATKIDVPLVQTTSPIDDMLDTMMGGKEVYGKLFLREHRRDFMDGWMAPKGIIEYVPKVESVGIMMPAGDIYNSSSRKLTKIPHAITELNMRDTGPYASLEHNFRQHLVDYMKSDDGQQLAVFLDKLGYKAEDIDYIAIGFVPEKAIYAIGRLPTGKVVIYANKDSYKMILNEAEYFGMSPKERMEKAIGEELLHNFRRSYDKMSRIPAIRIPEEKATKVMLKEFYETLAETTSNSELKAKYVRIIAQLEHDISTISRYAKIDSNNLQSLVGMYCTDIDGLEQVLREEASSKGLTEAEDIAAYVSERLDYIAGEVENYEATQNEAYAEAEVANVEGGLEAEVCATAEDGEVCAEAEASECADG